MNKQYQFNHNLFPYLTPFQITYKLLEIRNELGIWISLRTLLFVDRLQYDSSSQQYGSGSPYEFLGDVLL